MRTLSSRPADRNHGFGQVVAGFLSADGLPFADVLSAERIEAIFDRHNNLFGIGTIYSTSVVLWAFLGQVLRDQKEAACQSAVAHIVSFRLLSGLEPPSEDTGNYCRARAKLSAEALKETCLEIATELEDQAPSEWLWKGRHAYLADGFTFTMPDTETNQAEFPQPKTQAEGVGFPIARACVLLSLATACVKDLAYGPYQGKRTGETALLRQMLDSLSAGDVLVADSYYCSFLMIALLLGRGVDVCATMHASRHVDFRRGARLGKYDHLVTWHRPPRPEWMDEETYALIPKRLTLREIRYNVVEPGKRTEKLTVVTTLTDPRVDSKEDIAQLYGFRWNAELDIRSIKSTLNLDHVRCQSPQMVKKEVWTTFLAYNLIRSTAAAAALQHGKRPRQISFTATCQYVLAAWSDLAKLPRDSEVGFRLCEVLLGHIARCVVANRPGRIEPRVIKRRRHRYTLMRESRQKLQENLQITNPKAANAL